MNAPRFLAALMLLVPLAAFAAERPLKFDKGRTFIDVDVKATVDSFTGRLEAYDAKVNVDDAGKIKNAAFAFRFADLKTGKAERDAKMLEWLGGGDPVGRFEMGTLALTPDGQGQVSGRLTFHGVGERIEFPVNVTQADGVYTITGETTIDYRHWQLKVIRIALMLKVDPEVRIRFKLVGTPVEEPRK
ncbi:MAG: YceI family protein [Opitutaceae bacterium]|nr:YceI family protein [Opitutaceae bacterium]